tara:strand:- start:195 stop:401 length:207 start_codon:yes stop_codon:yes gene_type:complete
MAMNGGLSEIRSGIIRVHIASLNSPSEVTKSSLEKLYTFFVKGVKDFELLDDSCPNAKDKKKITLNIN